MFIKNSMRIAYSSIGQSTILALFEIFVLSSLGIIWIHKKYLFTTLEAKTVADKANHSKIKNRFATEQAIISKTTIFLITQLK